MVRTVYWRVGILMTLAVVVLGGFWLFSNPIPQPQSYHNFADQRSFWGLPHTLNVLSNVLFILAGIAGIGFMQGPRSQNPGIFIDPLERLPYFCYFIGLFLTGIGSCYYHAQPNNERLLWDRVPLTAAFMSLFSAVLTERIHLRCSRLCFWPLVLFGCSSVVMWINSERNGMGDMRFYLMVQFFPIIAIPFLLLFCPARYTRTRDLAASLGCYLLAKGLEVLDKEIYTQAGFVSGHTLKHLIAGVGSALILTMLIYRKPLKTLNPSPSV